MKRIRLGKSSWLRHCPYCDLAVRRVSGGSLCFDDPPSFAARGTSETECRGGLPCFLTPVLVDGRHARTIRVAGTPRLYTIVRFSQLTRGLLELRFSRGVEGYAFTFG